jgi:ABC-type bacteriocin/lantibiotic exporter with double-glycine peptidase domain
MSCRLLSLAMFCLSTGGCVGYTGSARSANPDVLKQERGWVAVEGVSLLRQQADHDCGPTALAMVVRLHLPSLAVERITRGFDIHRRASAAQLRDRARELGLSAFVIEGTVEDLAHELEENRPVIVGMAKPTVTGAVSHYEVVVAMHPETKRILTLDPAVGWQENSLFEFIREWTSTGSVVIIVLPPPPYRPPPIATGARISMAEARP